MNLVRQFISMLLLLILFSGIGIKSIVTFHYFFNKTEIIELFCVNKEKPQLQCNGKCHLAQELKEIEPINENEPFLPVQTIINLELVFILENTAFSFHKANTLSEYNSDFSTKKIVEQYFSITTPPPQKIA